MRPVHEIDVVSATPEEFDVWARAANVLGSKLGLLEVQVSPESVRAVAEREGLVVLERDLGLIYGAGYGIQFQVWDPVTHRKAHVVPRRTPYGSWQEKGREIRRIRAEAPYVRPTGEYGYEVTAIPGRYDGV